jgi:hypothetical protein
MISIKHMDINIIHNLWHKTRHLKTDGCERIKRDYNKKSERYWDDEIYHQRSAKKSRIMEEMKNVAETYKNHKGDTYCVTDLTVKFTVCDKNQSIFITLMIQLYVSISWYLFKTLVFVFKNKLHRIIWKIGQARFFLSILAKNAVKFKEFHQNLK